MRHPSAIKRHRQSLRRRARNQAVRSRVRGAIKKVRVAAEGPGASVEEAQKHLRGAERLLGKAVTAGVLHRNTASRHLSRLTRKVNALRSS